MTNTSKPKHNKQSRHKLLMYLLLPRPDGVFRASITLTGWFVANLLTNWQWWREGLVLAITFDFIVYQARYQWNDIRGMIGDLLSPMAADRARLPQAQRATLISLIAIVVRLCLALAICLFPWHSQAWPKSVAYFGLSVLAVVLLTIAYEHVRQHQRQTQSCSGISFTFVTILISLGYPLRFVVGFFITAPNIHLASTTPLIGYIAAFGLVGTMSVTMEWILEAASYGSVDKSKTTIATLNSTILRAKPHLYKNWLCAGLDGHLQDDSPMNGTRVFMHKKIRVHVWRIWNLAYFSGSFVSIVSIMAAKQQVTAWPVLIAIWFATLILFELLARVSSGSKAIFASSLLMFYFMWLTTGGHINLQIGLAFAAGLLWMIYYLSFYYMNYSNTLDPGSYIRAGARAAQQYTKRRYGQILNSLRTFGPSQANK